MINLKNAVVFLCLTSCCYIVRGQEDLNLKFGKISQADLQTSAPKFDSGANAVIIADVGKAYFVGNNTGGFSFVFTRFIRVKILNKNGFDVADHVIYLDNNRKGNSEKITELKGSTFNMENGVIKESKLDDKSVFTEKFSKYRDVAKFTMPGLKAGSVFDISYTIKTNYFETLRTWTFQHAYPCMWSEYEITIPSFYHFLIKSNGDTKFDVQNAKYITEDYAINRSHGNIGYLGASVSTSGTEMMGIRMSALKSKWIKKNVPALKEEPYLSTVKNFESKIDFEYSYFQEDKDSEKDNEIISWDSLSHYLLIDDDFGFELTTDNPWMDEELKTVTQGSQNQTEELKRIYRFVRNNFHCTDYSNMYIEKSLRDVFKKRSGNVGELNLLLIALLRHRNISADPVILSTRGNGMSTNDYPLLGEYNYVICVARAENKTYQLDASSPFNAFGRLPDYCYNWNARSIVDHHSEYLSLSPDSTSEVEVTSARLTNDEQGNLSGSLQRVFGNHEASEIRDEIKKNTLKKYFKNIQNDYLNMTVSNESFDSLENPDFPLILNYDLDMKGLGSSDIVYVNPLLSSGYQSNPFNEEKRLNPVQMSHKTDYSYFLTMEIPKGYQVEELPKSARVNLNETGGSFEYLIQKGTDKIQMKVLLKINKTNFPTDEYNNLRDFFAFVVKKESEQIVFKKIK